MIIKMLNVADCSK